MGGSTNEAAEQEGQVYPHRIQVFSRGWPTRTELQSEHFHQHEHGVWIDRQEELEAVDRSRHGIPKRRQFCRASIPHPRRKLEILVGKGGGGVIERSKFHSLYEKKVEVPFTIPPWRWYGYTCAFTISCKTCAKILHAIFSAYEACLSLSFYTTFYEHKNSVSLPYLSCPLPPTPCPFWQVSD